MAQINVTQFAKELGLPIELLIEQLQTAGVKKKLADDTVLTEKDKTQLLDYLRQSHGAREAKNKITLTRKQTTEIKKSDSTGKARTIQVEVRKKRVLVKRDAVVEAPVVAAPAAPVAQLPVVDAEQMAKREAEAKKQAELIALQSEEVQEKQSRARRKKADAEPVAEAPPAVVVPAPVAAAPAPAPATLAEGTLHKPQPKPGEKPKADKKAKKPVKEVVWRDESVKRRSIKTRGDMGGGMG